MVATELKTRIKNKIDDLSNWLSTDIVLLDGEIAIVRLSGENDIRAKVGNGNDPFSSLPYLNQSQLEELCSSLSLEISSSTFLSGVTYQDRLAYQLGSQSDKLLQPAGNYLSTSVFEDQISSVKDSLSALSAYADGISSEVSSLVGASLSNYVPISGEVMLKGNLSTEHDLIHVRLKTVTIKNLQISANDDNSKFNGDIVLLYDSKYIQDLTRLDPIEIPVKVRGTLMETGEETVINLKLVSPTILWENSVGWDIIDLEDTNVGYIVFNTSSFPPVSYDTNKIYDTFIGGSSYLPDSTEIVADIKNYIYDLPLATLSSPGLVQPDGSTIVIGEDGMISAVSKGDYVPLSGDSLVSNDLSVGSNLYVAGSSLCSIIDNEISSQTSSQFEGLSDAVSTLGGSLSNYVPLSGNTLVSNILSIETDLYVRDTSISDLISGGSSRVILREWF